MADADAHDRPHPTGRIVPGEVAHHPFGRAEDGLDEGEVRSFLRRVADEMAATRQYELVLGQRVHELEQRLRVMSGETAQELLREAQQRATGVVREAEELARARGKEILDEARDGRRRMLDDLEQRRRDFESDAAALRRARDRIREACSHLERALAAANAALASEPRPAPARPTPAPREPAPRARASSASPATPSAPAAGGPAAGREGSGRESTREPATGAKRPPSRGSAGSRTQAPAPAVPAAPETPETPETPELGDTPEAPETLEAGDTPEAPETPGRSRPRPEVGALFARLRAEAVAEPGGASPAPPKAAPPKAAPPEAAPPEAAPPKAASPEPTTEPTSGPAATSPGTTAATQPAGVAEPAERKPSEPEPVATRAAGAGGEGGDADDAARRARRDQVVRAGVKQALRPAKRLLQDDQNDLLDALRRHRGRIEPERLLASADDTRARWAAVLGPAVGAAYVAGRREVAPDSPDALAPGALVTELAGRLADPLRDRLLASLEDAVARAETDRPTEVRRALGSVAGARYREFRAGELESGIGDLVVSAYVRGSFDAAPPGAVLRWVAAEVGHCPDCDDNSLEPTVKGEVFPTGQPLPPAHPGCRCVLAMVAR